MAIKPGYKRLKEFDYLTELSEEARASLDIPENAEVVNITDKFREGGPIVVSYTIRGTDEQRKENRRNLQTAIDNALDDIALRCERDPVFFKDLKLRLGVT